jgi:DNA-binding PadR family transcriptional regulator
MKELERRRAMFGSHRGFVFGFAGGPDCREGWTPPWHQRNWHIFRHARHGFFGHEGPFGRGQRFFGRGDLKFALLELIRERPRHGYELIKALEEHSGGFYTPSPGSIYPTLQLLEDRGFVSVTEVGGKKIYSITDEGRVFLDEKKQSESTEDFVPPWVRDASKHWHSPEAQALRTEAIEIAKLFAIAGRSAFHDEVKLARLRAILERTHKDLSDLIHGTNPDPDAPK